MQLAVVPGDAAACDGGHSNAVHVHAFEDVEVHCMVVRGRADGALRAAIPHDDVRIAAHVDATLAWVKVEDAGGIRRCHCHKLLPR